MYVAVVSALGAAVEFGHQNTVWICYYGYSPRN